MEVIPSQSYCNYSPFSSFNTSPSKNITCINFEDQRPIPKRTLNFDEEETEEDIFRKKQKKMKWTNTEANNSPIMPVLPPLPPNSLGYDLTTVLSVFQRIIGNAITITENSHVLLKNEQATALMLAKEINCPGHYQGNQFVYICRLFLAPQNVQLSLTTAEKTTYSNELYDSDYYQLIFQNDIQREVCVFDYESFKKNQLQLCKDKLFIRYRYKRNGTLVIKSSIDKC